MAASLGLELKADAMFRLDTDRLLDIRLSRRLPLESFLSSFRLSSVPPSDLSLVDLGRSRSLTFRLEP